MTTWQYQTDSGTWTPCSAALAVLLLDGWRTMWPDVDCDVVRLGDVEVQS